MLSRRALCRFKHYHRRRIRLLYPSNTLSSNNSLIWSSPICCRSRRYFHIEGLAMAPVVFSGLFVSLWTWKCFMMVVFQNKIIYMPGLPPNSRWEKVQDYGDRLCGIAWREERVKAADGTDLALCVADVELGGGLELKRGDSRSRALPDRHLYILYFQGNAASIPPRLPDLSSTLTMLKRQLSTEPKSAICTVICLSYRGYWKSRGRPTEAGIRLDAVAALGWISRMHRQQNAYTTNNNSERKGTNCQAVNNNNIKTTTFPAEVILWGQSIGSGVATNLAADRVTTMPDNLCLNSLILETPFTSIRAMLEVLYPQKWLPYKYLWPFLRNHLDSWKNMGIIAEKCQRNNDDNNEKNEKKRKKPEIMILQAAKDELVPAKLSQKLYDRCKDLQFPVRRVAVDGAFHNDAMFRTEGKKAVAEFLARKILES